jgi:integrase
MSPAEQTMTRHQADPLTEHFAAYDLFLQAGGVTAIHRSYTARYLKRLATECRFDRLADLDREALERWLAARAAEGMAAKTRNIYRGALVAFANWAVEHNRLAANPFVAVAVANAKADRRRVRRSMTEDELGRLLDIARRRPLLEACTVRKGPRKGERYGEVRPEVRRSRELLGRERALIYKTLLLCGLRKAELTALTVGQVYLDSPVPFVRLNAAAEKNKEGSELVLRDDLAGDLRGWLADKLARLQEEARGRGEPIPLHPPGETPLFTVPAGLLRIFNRDLRMAGIPKKDERGRTLDVHGLRTTLATFLNRAGVAPRTAQALMRHSEISLTMQTYTDPRLLDLRGALDALPTLPVAGAAEAATGTEGMHPGRGEEQLALPLAGNPGKRGRSGSIADKLTVSGTPVAQREDVAVRSSGVNRKGPLTSAVNGPKQSGRQDLNLRPHGPEPSPDRLFALHNSPEV